MTHDFPIFLLIFLIYVDEIELQYGLNLPSLHIACSSDKERLKKLAPSPFIQIQTVFVRPFVDRKWVENEKIEVLS